MKIGNNGNLVLGSFDESTPCLMIVLMNCQTKLRINHVTAVKSVAILESNANLNFYTWNKTLFIRNTMGQLSGCGYEFVAGVSWARVLLPLKTRRVDEAIPPADVVVRKKGCQLRCPPRHSIKVQNYDVCDQWPSCCFVEQR
ncbi:alpha-2 adrenergic receptor [Trichonephila clavipes]|nr:alpha-2 adrenergic receptor [Trichonephila clavipes]